MPTMSGDLVHAREALWRVLHVRAAQDRVRLVSLRGADDHNRWKQCTLLEPFDRVTLRPVHETPRVVSRRRWMRALVGIVASAGCAADAADSAAAAAADAAAGAADAASATAGALPLISLASLADASVRLLAYQLEPLLAIVRGVASRLLIADGVGLGKTIQAALVLRELASRHRGSRRAARMLVVVPAGLRDQWKRELRARVGLDSRILDAHALATRVRELPSDINPWSLPGISIVSLDFIKQDVVLHGMRGCVWDALVLDEAHALTPGTDRAAAAHLLARHGRLVLMLTATPHDGDDATFDALCRIGRHARGGGSDADDRIERHARDGGADSDADAGADADTDDRIAVFRRTRETLGLPSARRVHVLRVTPTPAERHLHHLLARYVTRVEREQHRTAGAEPEPAALALAMTVLQKRASSSAWSLARSLERRAALLAHAAALEQSAAAGRPIQPAQWPLPFELHKTAAADQDRDAGAGAGAEAGAGDGADADAGADAESAAEAETNAEDAEPLACLSTPGLASAHVERAWLMLLIRAAHRAAARESKRLALRRLLSRLREPAIVYTEYRDTLKHLAAALPAPLAVLHGGLTREAREDALRAFATGRVNVLLATDAAGEGLNLQQRCRLVINVELPWNPNRLEQRIGRVDRLGQSKMVHAFHLVSPDTAESALLDTLTHRITHIAESLRRGREHGEDGEYGDADRGIRRWPNLSREAAETVRTLERLRMLRTAATAATAANAATTHQRDPLIELDTRAPWIFTVRARHRGPLATVPRGAIFIWRTRLRSDADSEAELITALHLAWPTIRTPWPIPSAAREAMQRKLDARAREAIEARHARERPFRDRAARREHAILAARRDMQMHADADIATDSVRRDARLRRQPLLFNDIAAARATSPASPHMPPPARQPVAPQTAPQAEATAEPAPTVDVDFDHTLLLILHVR